MINNTRLTQIEISLPPKEAVLVWVRRDIQCKTAKEYASWLVAQPVTQAPRVHIGRQVGRSVQEAMKGQEEKKIQRAALQAAKEADLLILLVNATYEVVRSSSRSGWLRFSAADMLLRYSDETADDEPDEKDPDFHFRTAFIEFLSIPKAVDQIREQYFNGECILPLDEKKDLEFQTTFARGFIEAIDNDLKKHGFHDLVIGSDEFWNSVGVKASELARYIYALAKSRMLERFGFGDEAHRLLAPFI